jgi:hypothetical protein
MCPENIFVVHKNHTIRGPMEQPLLKTELLNFSLLPKFIISVQNILPFWKKTYSAIMVKFIST